MNDSIVDEDLSRITSADLPWSKFAGKQVLISGGTGFLPAYMAEVLLHLNEGTPSQRTKVIVLARNHQKATARFARYIGRSDLAFIIQDVCAPIPADTRADFVIHAASQASPKYYGMDPVGTLAANTLGTANLLDFARRQPCEGFLFFSSSEVYGEVNPLQIPTAEECLGYLDPAKVRSCYGESKRMGETMCVAWAEQHHVPAKIVRPFHTYGPGMSLDDGRVFADFIANIVHGKNILLKSDGAARRAFCYLADAVAGFFTVLLKGQVAMPYNVGNPNAECSIRELAERLVLLFPEKNLHVICNPQANAKEYIASSVSRNCPDTTRIGRLGWRPTTGVDEGFVRAVRSFH